MVHRKWCHALRSTATVWKIQMCTVCKVTTHIHTHTHTHTNTPTHKHTPTHIPTHTITFTWCILLPWDPCFSIGFHALHNTHARTHASNHTRPRMLIHMHTLTYHTKTWKPHKIFVVVKAFQSGKESPPSHVTPWRQTSDGTRGSKYPLPPPSTLTRPSHLGASSPLRLLRSSSTPPRASTGPHSKRTVPPCSNTCWSGES